MNNATFITEVTVIDPDSQGEVKTAIFKDQGSGATFGVDSSYLETFDDDEAVIVTEPINGKLIELTGI